MNKISISIISFDDFGNVTIDFLKDKIKFDNVDFYYDNEYVKPESNIYFLLGEAANIKAFTIKNAITIAILNEEVEHMATNSYLCIKKKFNQTCYNFIKELNINSIPDSEVNIHFNKLYKVLKNSGQIYFGSGICRGLDKHIKSTNTAFNNPNVYLPKSFTYANKILIKFITDDNINPFFYEDVVLFSENFTNEKVDIIFSSTIESTLEDGIKTSLIVTFN